MILIGIAWAAVAVAPVTPTVAAVATRIHRAQHCIGSLLFVLLIFFVLHLTDFLYTHFFLLLWCLPIGLVADCQHSRHNKHERKKRTHWWKVNTLYDFEILLSMILHEAARQKWCKSLL